MNEFIKWRLVSAPSLVLKGKQTVANDPDPFDRPRTAQKSVYILPPTDICNTKLESH